MAPESTGAAALYRDILMEHYHHPRNRGDLRGADRTARGDNPLCGDEIEVGVFLDDPQGLRVRFRGRGCAILTASASMMTEAVAHLSRAQTLALCSEIGPWLAGKPDAKDPPDAIAALACVRAFPARHRCVLLAWEALEAALAAF